MDILPDEYNLVVVCGKYFGSDYMKNGKISIDISEKSMVENAELGYMKALLDETIEDFNDMGMMQALDMVYMTQGTLDYLGKSSEEMRHIIGFGSSHGGYLSYLANALSPKLFTYILDVSGYMYPYYLNATRKLRVNVEKAQVKMMLGFEYLINRNPKLEIDESFLNLFQLYSTFENHCRVISFQGTKDWMVDYKEKQRFIEMLGEKAELMLFSEEDVDGTFIKDANHGLGMNFVLMFQMILPLISETSAEREKIEDESFELSYGNVKIEMRNSFPIILEAKRKKE